jgi:hypothetical protein
MQQYPGLTRWADLTWGAGEWASQGTSTTTSTSTVLLIVTNP